MQNQDQGYAPMRGYNGGGYSNYRGNNFIPGYRGRGGGVYNNFNRFTPYFDPRDSRNYGFYNQQQDFGAAQFLPPPVPPSSDTEKFKKLEDEHRKLTLEHEEAEKEKKRLKRLLEAEQKENERIRTEITQKSEKVTDQLKNFRTSLRPREAEPVSGDRTP